MRTSQRFVERNPSIVVTSILLTAVFLLASSSQITAQETQSPERARAFQLYDQNNFIDAIHYLDPVAAEVEPGIVAAIEGLVR